MTPRHCLTVLLSFLLLHTPWVWGEDKILVAGDPPLTQELVDGYRSLFEVTLDLRLTEQQRRDWQQLLVAGYTKRKAVDRAAYLNVYRKAGDTAKVVARVPEAQRVQLRPFPLTLLWGSDDAEDRLMLEIYRATHRNDKETVILVLSEPPWTNTLMEQRVRFLEWLFDLSLTPAQRREYERLFLQGWKGCTKEQREHLAENTRQLADVLSSLSALDSHLARAASQAGWLAALKQSEDDSDRYLLKLYEEAYKPGGSRNPVLAAGDPPLTRDLVERFGDRLEWLFEMSASGGLTAPQRQDLQELLTARWKKMDPEARKQWCADLADWSDKVAPLDDKQRHEWRRARRPKLLAELRANPEDPLNRWLLDLYNREVELLKQKIEFLKWKMEMNRQLHEDLIRIIKNMDLNPDPRKRR
jgi:hypothetical protein